MIINKFAFGNEHEAFIESRLKDNVNIIFSNDNNRGKTLVIQGMMYCLGSEPIFPASFEQNKYYFYLQFLSRNKQFEIIRKKDTLIIKSEDIFQICNSISEFKYFFDQHIEPLPKISKDHQERLIDPTLFLELFFIGQDKRDTSNIFSKGFYNKSDFISMLFSMNNLDERSLSADEIRNVKSEILAKKNKLASLTKELGRLKIAPEIGSILLSTSDKEQHEKSKKKLSDIYDNLSHLKRQRTRELNRANKLESLITELNSLNRNIEEGMVVCADCGSERIVYKNKELDFEISNSSVKSTIINSIKESIALKLNITSDLTQKIEYIQRQLTEELKQSPPSFRDLILFSGNLLDATSIDEELKATQSELDKLNVLLASGMIISKEEKERQDHTLRSILGQMNKYYKQIDPNGRQEYEALFTKRDETYSGSEGQEFYFCKLMAIRDHLNHSLPLVIDAFREGEISSGKEETMLNIFEDCGNQVILTSTLKDEEYESEKYVKTKTINVIDYSSNDDSKILNRSCTDEFLSILKNFNITFSIQTT